MPLTQPQNFFVTSTDNSFGGTGTGDDNQADRVTAVGARAAQDNALGADDVIAIGVDTLQNNKAANQIVIGNDAGGSGGAGLDDGENVVIGHSAAPTARDFAGNVVIGFEAANSLILQACQGADHDVIIAGAEQSAGSSADTNHAGNIGVTLARFAANKYTVVRGDCAGSGSASGFGTDGNITAVTAAGRV